MIKKTLILLFLVLFTGNLNAFANTYKMVFVPASEKGDESDYTTLISITEKLTGLKIETIKVTDYNAAVEAMRAGRATLLGMVVKHTLKLLRLQMQRHLLQVLDQVKKMQVIIHILLLNKTVN